MNITTEKDSLFYTITIDGELDASSSILLDNTLTEAISKNETKILVDCNHLNYISSAGLGVFMSYLQDFEIKGISMVLFNMSEKVKNVFSILGLDELIKIVPTREDAKKIMS